MSELERSDRRDIELQQPGPYELAEVGDGFDEGPSPRLRRRRLLVGIVAVVAIVALAITAIGVGSFVFLV